MKKSLLSIFILIGAYSFAMDESDVNVSQKEDIQLEEIDALDDNLSEDELNMKKYLAEDMDEKILNVEMSEEEMDKELSELLPDNESLENTKNIASDEQQENEISELIEEE